MAVVVSSSCGECKGKIGPIATRCLKAGGLELWSVPSFGVMFRTLLERTTRTKIWLPDSDRSNKPVRAVVGDGCAWEAVRLADSLMSWSAVPCRRSVVEVGKGFSVEENRCNERMDARRRPRRGGGLANGTSLFLVVLLGVSLLSISSAEDPAAAARTCSLQMVTSLNGILLHSEASKQAQISEYVPFKTIVCAKPPITSSDSNCKAWEMVFPYKGFFVAEEATVSMLPVARQRAAESSSNAINLDQNDTANFYSQHHLTTHLDVGEWFDQLPIGNGKLGAFVGGNLFQEIVPLSMSSFYSYDSRRIQGDDYNGYEQYMPGQRNNRGKFEQYKRSRQSLLEKGDFFMAMGQLNSLEGARSMGGFQGTADLSIAFGQKPMSINPRRDGPKDSFQILGRGTLMNMLKEQLTPSPSAIDETHVLLSKGELDMRSGLALEQFLVTSRRTPKSLQHVFREWFVSEHHDVVVGSLHCHDYQAESSPCLHAAVRMSRGHDHPRGVVDSVTYLTNFALSEAMLQSSFAGVSSTDVSASLMETVITKQAGSVVPATVTCALAVCLSKSHTPGNGDVFLCNHATAMHVISSTVSVPSLGMPIITYSSDPAVVQQLRTACVAKIENAVLKGIALLKRRHIKHFVHRMSGATLGIGAPLSPADMLARKGSEVDQEDSVRVPRMFQLGRYLLASAGTNSVSNLQGIWSDGKQSAWNGDYHFNINLEMQYWPAYSVGLGETFPPLLQFVEKLARQGRRAAREVFGCQEQVAFDATTSAFSFRTLPYTQLNPNSGLASNFVQPGAPIVQPSTAQQGRRPVGAHPTPHLGNHPSPMQADGPNPLTNFDSSLINNTFMENLAWVANGYTDSRLKGEPLGEFQWALCVTCGAWLSSHLFEYLLYQPWERLLPTVEESILPIFRGLALFFKEHIAIDRSANGRIELTHTGPTTSPENSFEFNLHGRKGISFVTMTPAIDISVLRELVNMYGLMVDWLATSKGKSLQLDMALAADLRTLVYSLPNNGLPSVSPKTSSIMEYPDPFILRAAQSNPSKQSKAFPPSELEALSEIINDKLDSGHRHFSPYHYLYPGIFHPWSSAEDYQQLLGQAYGQKIPSAIASLDWNQTMNKIYRGTMVGLLSKAASHSGHTSWSASWESALNARAYNTSRAYAALTRLLDHFVVNNYLSVHPSLNGMPIRACKTCFTGQEKHFDEVQHSQANIYRSDEKNRSNVPGLFSDKRRSFDLTDGTVFQMDGNLGFVAALLEMIVHHHHPRILHFLPALPAEWNRGYLYGVQLRGHRSLDIRWQDGRVAFAVLTFRSAHPWLTSVAPATRGDLSDDESYKVASPRAKSSAQSVLLGFFRGKAAPTVESQSVHLFSPNALQRQAMKTSVPACALDEKSQATSISIAPGLHRLSLPLEYGKQTFPCQIVLCDASSNAAQCQQDVAAINDKNHQHHLQ